MFDYTIAKTADNSHFKWACEQIEKHIDNLNKDKLLVDVDGSTVQIYHADNGDIRIDNDFEIDAVFVTSDIDLSHLFN